MNLKILIADNDYDNRKILKDALEASGFAVVEAADGKKAMDMAQEELPGLIFMARTMPKMDGWEVARRLRQLPQTAQVTIIGFSTNATEGEEAKALAAGCDDYVTKPCLPREVVKKVPGWLMARRKTGKITCRP